MINRECTYRDFGVIRRNGNRFHLNVLSARPNGVIWEEQREKKNLLFPIVKGLRVKLTEGIKWPHHLVFIIEIFNTYVSDLIPIDWWLVRDFYSEILFGNVLIGQM